MIQIGTVECQLLELQLENFGALHRVAVTGDGTGVGHSRSGPKDDVRTAGSGAGCEDLQGAVLEADWR